MCYACVKFIIHQDVKYICIYVCAKKKYAYRIENTCTYIFLKKEKYFTNTNRIIIIIKQIE